MFETFVLAQPDARGAQQGESLNLDARRLITLRGAQRILGQARRLSQIVFRPGQIRVVDERLRKDRALMRLQRVGRAANRGDRFHTLPFQSTALDEPEVVPGQMLTVSDMSL